MDGNHSHPRDPGGVVQTPIVAAEPPLDSEPCSRNEKPRSAEAAGVDGGAKTHLPSGRKQGGNCPCVLEARDCFRGVPDGGCTTCLAGLPTYRRYTKITPAPSRWQALLPPGNLCFLVGRRGCQPDLQRAAKATRTDRRRLRARTRRRAPSRLPGALGKSADSTAHEILITKLYIKHSLKH